MNAIKLLDKYGYIEHQTEIIKDMVLRYNTFLYQEASQYKIESVEYLINKVPLDVQLLFVKDLAIVTAQKPQEKENIYKFFPAIIPILNELSQEKYVSFIQELKDLKENPELASGGLLITDMIVYLNNHRLYKNLNETLSIGEVKKSNKI